MYYSIRSKFDNLCILCEKLISVNTSCKVGVDDGDVDVNKSINASGFNCDSRIVLVTAFQKCFCQIESRERLIDEFSIDDSWFCSLCAKLLIEWWCENLAQKKASRMSQIKATLTSKLLSSEGSGLDVLLEKTENKFQRNFLLLVKSVKQQLKSEYSVQVKVEKLKDISALTARLQCASQDIHSKIGTQKDLKISNGLQCSFLGCNYRTVEPCKLTDHQRIHTDEKPFSCPREGCNFRSNWKKSITDHQRTHQKEKHKPFACSFPNCDYRAYQPSKVKYHEKIHLTVPGNIACPFPGCDYRTIWKTCLQLHLVTHEKDEEKRRPYECDYPGCKQRFTQSNNLRSHTQRVHGPKDVKPFSCNFPGCDYKGQAKQYLKKHEELHGPKKHQCPQCPKKFHNKQHLRTHLPTHSEEKPFACSYPSCTFRARIKDTVRIHKKIHLNLRPFPCTFPGCNYRASEDCLRRNHEATHDPFRSKNFQCIICSRGFCSRSLLSSHIKRHLNETAYKCGQCKYEAFTAKELNLHVERKHRNPIKRRPRNQEPRKVMDGKKSPRIDKLFKCRYCDFSSDLTSGLGNHLAIKHPEEQVISFG